MGVIFFVAFLYTNVQLGTCLPSFLGAATGIDWKRRLALFVKLLRLADNPTMALPAGKWTTCVLGSPAISVVMRAGWCLA
jgi:hypothetical protein